jgi:D-alanyl-lipoteichoic acid acyltransferase DltB (MBOAT superfamily)
MAFNSLHFLVYFPTVLVLYHLLPDRFRWMLLLAASLYFYMAWRAVYVVLLLAAIVVSYVVGIKVEDSEQPTAKRRYLALGLTVLLGNLFVFKYFNFFNDSVRSLVEAMGVHYGLGALKLVLPIGISFYTFQKASYLIDIYRGKQKAERHLGIFSLYSSFFPQLVAGPIERGPHLLPQFREVHRFNYGDVASGLRLMAWGFFKKCVVADRLAPMVNDVYSTPTQQAGTSLFLATLFFAFQVYCDFSGYSDIAVGCAQTIGFRLMANFRQPYFSTSIQEFWKRWHISLSSWLTDYVYTPFTRAKWLKMHWYPKLLLSLLLTFLVSGLWHGANWTFVVWGAMHGLYLIVAVLMQKRRAAAVKAIGLDKKPVLLKWVNIVFTFTLVCIAYIFFRANTLSDAFYILVHAAAGIPQLRPSSIAEFDNYMHNDFVLACLGIGIVMLNDYAAVNNVKLVKDLWEKRWVRRSFDFAVTAGIVLFGAFYGGRQTFIYFEF